jgi:hypothetical protein
MNMTVGIDLAKNVFQVDGVDARGKVVLRRQLRREQLARFFVNLPPCLVGMESCASAHHWGRKNFEFTATPQSSGRWGKTYAQSIQIDRPPVRSGASKTAVTERSERARMTYV